MDGRTRAIVGGAGLTGNPHDPATLGAALENVGKTTGKKPAEAATDSGLRLR